MTSYSNKKTRERHIALEAAKQLGVHWVLFDHEAPDFIVTDDRQRFGLVLTEVFSGPYSRDGSHRKEREARVQRCINRLKEQYEAETGTPLSVQLVGHLSHENLNCLVPRLMAMDLAGKPQGYRTQFSHDQSEASLSVHVCRAPHGHARWRSVNDDVGWTVLNPTERIQVAVHNKAMQLADYRKHTDLSNQRLLVFCNAIMNSGKLRVTSDVTIDPAGFDAVYFFTYPDAATVIVSNST